MFIKKERKKLPITPWKQCQNTEGENTLTNLPQTSRYKNEILTCPMEPEHIRLSFGDPTMKIMMTLASEPEKSNEVSLMLRR